MSNVDTIDISHIRFESRVSPTDADMKIWNALSPEEQHAVIMRDVENGLASGDAKAQSVREIVETVRAEMGHEG